MEDVTHFKQGIPFMHPIRTCCMRITNIFKQGRYSFRSHVFTQHGWFNLLLWVSW